MFWLVAAGMVAGAMVLLILLRQPKDKAPQNQDASASAGPDNDQRIFDAYAGSESCRDCHSDAYNHWRNSHHALAERAVVSALDERAFDPHRVFHHGSQTSEVRRTDGNFQVVAVGADAVRRAFRVERVVGVEPLRQFLAPAAGGRFQVTETAFDPAQDDWFDIFGEEDRKPGEWGHWTGRGMTWNVMCAGCHNTRVRKNYLAASDSYATAMAEPGIGCESCHGPAATHVAWQRARPQPAKGDPTIRRLNWNQMLSACGSCHARRTELTGNFAPGDEFLDHYGLVIPDETDLYYPDGQVREEDYEYTSFLSSRLHASGVRCMDCHEPHTGKTRAPDNTLCLRCHAGPILPAPKIDAAAHTHHLAGTVGDQCVNCHMPQTVYMQRHARRDHGFTIPDPLLTKQFGIPNACHRCHTHESVDWTLSAVERWYGSRMNRPTRARAQWIAQARAGQNQAAQNLARLLREEKIPLWRAVAAGLLKRWSIEPDATSALLAGARDADALVRAMAARSLESPAQSQHAAAQQALRDLLVDPVRAVRIEAAWALRSTVNTNGAAGVDLLRYLALNLDQPSGQLQMGVFDLDRNDHEQALVCFRRAVSWDAGSAPLRQALAVSLSLKGEKEAAVRELEAACRLAPREAEYPFKLGLALNEVGRTEEAAGALEKAVQLDPQFAQAWYNLGLANSALGKPESALEALTRAESMNAASAQIPYARATILARLGRGEEARAAARRALEIRPGFSEAAALLQLLVQEERK